MIHAVADCQNALDSLVYSLRIDKSAIQQKIKEADERAERIYGRASENRKADRSSGRKDGRT